MQWPDSQPDERGFELLLPCMYGAVGFVLHIASQTLGMAAVPAWLCCWKEPMFLEVRKKCKARVRRPLHLQVPEHLQMLQGHFSGLDQTTPALQVTLVTEIRPVSVASRNYSSLLEGLQDFLIACPLTFQKLAVHSEWFKQLSLIKGETFKSPSLFCRFPEVKLYANQVSEKV